LTKNPQKVRPRIHGEIGNQRDLYPENMNTFLGKQTIRSRFVAIAVLAIASLAAAASGAFATPPMTSTLSVTSVAAGDKVDLTTQLPAVSAVDNSTQEIIQSIDSTKVRLTSSADVIAPAGWAVTYSTDGTTFAATPSSWSAVVKVKATGQVNSGGATGDGKQIYTTTASLPGTVNTVDGASRAGGDGYDTEFDSRGYLYNTYHHNYADGALDCRKRSDGSFCGQNWPFGLASKGFSSNFASTQFFDEVYKHLWLPVADRSTGTGFLCIDVSDVQTPMFCGGSKATAWHMIQPRANANEAGVTDIIGSNGKVYAWDMLAPRVLCYDYLANDGMGAACTSMPTFPRLVAGVTRSTNNIPFTYSGFKAAFGNIYGQLNGVAVCFNAVTQAKCTGWAAYDFVLGTNSSVKILYVQPNASGQIAGVCSTADAQCFAENGTRFAANTTVQAGLTQGQMSYWNGAVERAGSKLLWTSYFDKPSTTYCYDYATSSACAGWAASTFLISGVGQMNTSSWRIYTLKVDPLSDNCMWTNGDLAQGIKQFTISTAQPGCAIKVDTVSFPQSSVQPRLACSLGSDVSYNRFTIGGAAAGVDYTSAKLTIVKANGEVAVSGGKTWSDLAFNASGFVDLSTLAFSDLGLGATFKVAYSNRTTWNATTGSLTMQSDSAQLCLSVTAQVACPTTVQIKNLSTQVASFTASGATISSGGSRIDYTVTSPDLSIAPPTVPSACGFQLRGVVAQLVSKTSFPSTINPLAGAVATLLDSNGTAINDPATGNPITATTQADGTYTFGYVKAGSYKLSFADFPATSGFSAAEAHAAWLAPYGYFTGQVTQPLGTANFASNAVKSVMTPAAVTGAAGGADIDVRATYIVRAIAKDDAISIKAGATLNTLNVLANDSPTSDQTFTKTTIKICAAGTTTSCALTSLAVANQGTYGINTSTGAITFTPLASFTGIATSIVYQITDNYPITVNASLQVTVVAAPTTVADGASGNLLAPITVDVTANDTPATGATLDKASVKLCASGTTTNCALTSVAIAGKGTYSVSALGIVTFTPERTFTGVAPGLTYSITDSVGNVVTNTVTATVTPTPPTITTPAIPSTGIGVPITPVAQTLTLGNSDIPSTGTWTITAGALPAGLTMNPNTGEITGTPTVLGNFSFTVRVTDASGQTATKVESISVFNGPTITTVPLTYSVYAGTPLTITDTVTPGAGVIKPTAAWSATGLPAGMTINTTTGVISGTPTTDGVYPIVVQVTDVNNLSDTETLTVTVTTKPVITTPTPLTRAVQGVAITAIPQTKTQGTASIPAAGAWAITSGALPAGLSFNPDSGEITGTATVSGTFPFTVQLTDAAGEIATKAESITVIAPPTVTTSPLSRKFYAGTLNSITSTATIGTGAITPTGWSATSLPPGMTINASTGLISGTPTTNGTYVVTERVTDVNGLWDEEILTITIVTKPVITTPTPLPFAIMNQPITAIPQTHTVGSAAIPATGAWSIVGGALPAGLSMNPDNGEITGTPTTPGAYTFTVQLVASDGEIATKVETMSVGAPPVITTTPLTQKYYNGTAVTLPNTATKGTANLMTTAGAWAATGLPTGLTINTATGVISGTPTVDGVFTVNLTVNDVSGLNDTEAMTITVVTKPVITTPSPLAQQIVGVQIVPEAQTSVRGTAIIPATGAWSVSAGTLPAGLTLNPDTGEITGTPTVGGDYSFTVKLADAAGEFATKVETMRVLAGPEITTTPQSYMINLDEPWSLSQTAIKGTGNLLAASAWIFSALPEGLTANLTTGVISGFPKSVGETDVTVTVVDVNGLSDTTVIKIKVIEPPRITTPRNLGSFELGSSPAPIAQTVDLGSAPLIAQNPWTSVIGSASIYGVSPVDGAIQVTPNALGTFTFTATITDENGNTDTATYTLTVVPAGSNITSLVLPAALVPDTNMRVTSYPLTGLGGSSKNLPVNYTAGPPTVCYVDSAKVLQILGLGDCAVTAQSGSLALLSKATQTFKVKKAPQTVTIIPPGTTVNGITAPEATDSSAGFKLKAPMSSGLSPVFESLTRTICMVEPDGTVSWLVDASKVGMNKCLVKVSQPGDAAFYPLEDAPSNTYEITAKHVKSPAVPPNAVETEKPIGTPRTPGTYKQGPWTITITNTKITVLGPVSSGTFIGPVIAVTKIPYTVTVKGKKVNKTQICTIEFGLQKPFKKADPLAWINRITKPSVPCTLNAEAYAFYKAGNSVKLTTVVTRDRRWPTTNLNKVGDDGKGKLIPKIVSNWKISIG